MAVTDRDRSNLLSGLEEALGPQQADTLMNLLPTQPASELVTITYFQSEMGAFRSQMHAEFSDFRAEMQGEFSDFRAELKGDVLRVENSLSLRIANVETGMAKLHSSLTRWIVALGAANVITVVTTLAN